MSIKIKAIWISLVSLFILGKKKSRQPMTDAIRFPDFPNKHILEDYEVAAYHNQA
jgi:hypothetical protein